MRDDFYDLYSNQTVINIKKLRAMGHNIGLHINLKTFDNKKNLSGAEYKLSLIHI